MGSKEDCKLRFALLVERFNDFYEGFEDDNIFLNYDLLNFAVIRYFTDTEKLKQDAKIYGLIDNHKKAAYTIKWISKLRPIQLKVSKDTSVYQQYVNHYFAIIAGIAFLDDVKITNIPDKYLVNLLCLCQNENIQGKFLSSEMYLLENAFSSVNNSKNELVLN